MVKEILKTKDLKEMGFTDYSIRQMCHMKGSPFYQLLPGGDWRVNKDDLYMFLDNLTRKEAATC